MEPLVAAYVKEGCGINNIARLMGISKVTVIKLIRSVAAAIGPPSAIPDNGSYEMDELHTFIGSKARECYVIYAICRNTRKVVDFIVGRRTKQNLGRLTKKLLDLSPNRIYTDALNIYPLETASTRFSSRLRFTRPGNGVLYALNARIFRCG
jgi:insertion element IS1 protein InsB